MQLLASWRESLAFFIPKNFKLFLLVTLKSTLISTWLWIKYCLWVFPIYIFLVRQLFIGFSFLFFSLFLCIRPSVKRKTIQYFADYWLHFLVMTILSAVIGLVITMESFRSVVSFDFVINLLLKPILSMKPKGPGIPGIGFNFLENLFIELQFVVIFFMITIITLISTALLFYYDTRGRIYGLLSSLRNGSVMMLYNFPFFLIAFLFFICASYMHTAFMVIVIKSYSYELLEVVEYTIFGVALTLIYANFIANFYVKRLHDQPSLYVLDGE